MISAPQIVFFSSLYTVLVMVLVSLDGTYSITYNLFGKLVGSKDQTEYGTGMNIKNRGFLLHILVFAILIVIPMVACKSHSS